MRNLLSLLLLTILTSCQRAPDSYPPPIQRKPLDDGTGPAVGVIVNMNDTDATTHFVRDISPGLEGGRWRWTYERPELNIYIASTTGLKLLWEFSIASVTFEKTGPITVSFFINNKLLAKMACQKSGDFKFERPVPPEYLRANSRNLVSAQADKLWVSPTDGVKLGFTLTRVGFLP
jgi:hypothetical protein